MKYGFILCFLLTPFIASYADTTYVIRDSIYADSVYGDFAMQLPAEATGYPDSSYASFTGGALLDLTFRAYGGIKLRAMLKGAEVRFWGKKTPEVDSSAAKVIFFKTDQFGNPQYESTPYYIGEGLTTITLDRDYTYIEFSLTESNEPGDTIPGSQGYLLDAVLLLQNRDSIVIEGAVSGNPLASASAIVANYPNPFVAAAGTTLLVRMESPGDASLYIFDISGREVERMPLRMLEAGDHLVPISVPQPQVYLARLFVDGIPTGTVYRITAR